MSQPLDRNHVMPALGEIDEERGEFWVDNPFKISASGENLSAFERNRLYMNLDGQSFLDVSFASGVDIESDSRSAICADFNDDGAEDMLVCSVGGGPLRLFINRYPTLGRKIRVNLVGKQSNVAAIGARVILHIGERRIIRDLFPSNGFMGQRPPELLIGVGDATEIDRLEVRWPTGQTQRFEKIAANSRVTIREGAAEPKVQAFE